MKFVGGPMHGREVPEDAVRFFVLGRELVRVLSLDYDSAGHLTQVTHNYLKMPYWRFRKPALQFFACIGMQQDELIEQARRLLGP